MPDYLVRIEGAEPEMIRASNKSAAMNFAVRLKVSVSPLTTEDAIALALEGKKLLIAGEEPEPEPEVKTEPKGDGEPGAADPPPPPPQTNDDPPPAPGRKAPVHKEPAGA